MLETAHRSDFDELAQQLDRVVDKLLQRTYSPLRTRHCWTPAINTYRVAGGIEVSLRNGESAAVLTVRDSGVGIPAGELPFLFDRFHRANSKPGGAGLGLAIGNAIVTATGGRWEVGDSPSGGARMAVHWPLIRGPREEDPAPLGSPEAPPANSPVSG